MKNRTQSPLTLNSLYGEYTITEPILIALINSPTVQRMKNIHQYGVTRYRINFDYTRYDHSIGVMVLLRHFGASLNEQIAGLLHDASHTAFSHVGDIVFDHKDHTQSYQDSIHEWFLAQTETPNVLNEFGLSVEDVFHKSGNHRMLEQDLPNICADRFEYNLMGMVGEGLFTQEDINEILNNIIFKDGSWVFTNLEAAQKFAYAQLRLNELTWGDPWNGLGYHLAARALKHAIGLKLITPNQMHFGSDDNIWHILRKSNDNLIKTTTDQILDPQKYYGLIRPSDEAMAPARRSPWPTKPRRSLLGDDWKTDKLADEGEWRIKPKFRGIDPWVEVDGEIKRLRDIDSDFANEFEKTKQKLNAGFWAKLK